MKIVARVCLTLLLVVVGTVAGFRYGYSEEPASSSDIELMRSDLRTKKVGMITERMRLTDQEADAFWPIYRKYEVELAAINDRKIALMKDYLSNYSTLDDPRAKQLVQDVLDVDQATVDLRKRFFGEFEKALNAKTAARWLQLERRLQLFLDAKLAKDLPSMKR
jgi:hypothetical protein